MQQLKAKRTVPVRLEKHHEHHAGAVTFILSQGIHRLLSGNNCKALAIAFLECESRFVFVASGHLFSANRPEMSCRA